MRTCSSFLCGAIDRGALAGGRAGGAAGGAVFIVLLIGTVIALAFARGLENESGWAKGLILVFVGFAVVGSIGMMLSPEGQRNPGAKFGAIGMAAVWIAWFLLTSRRGTRLTAAIGTTLFIVGNILSTVAEMTKGHGG